MPRNPRLTMPARDAARLRSILRQRIELLGVTRAEICPPIWKKTSAEAGIRKLARVLEPRMPLAYEDAWELIDYLGKGTRRRNGEQVWVLESAFAFIERKAADCKPLGPREERDLAKRRAQARAGDMTPLWGNAAERVLASLTPGEDVDALDAFSAYLDARELVRVNAEMPSLLIFPGQTKNLAAYIERVLQTTLRYSDKATRLNIRRQLLRSLYRFEAQATQSDIGRLVLSTIKEHQGDDFAHMFLGTGLRGIDDRPESARVRGRVNPWRSRTELDLDWEGVETPATDRVVSMDRGARRKGR